TSKTPSYTKSVSWQHHLLIQYINSITKFIYDQWHTHE
ncbi:transposase, partial [Shigella dysenteriae]